MQASITIGGIEVALTMAPGGLEAVVAERYAPFLGAVESPVCSVVLESNRRDEGRPESAATLVERFDDTKYRLVHPGLLGLIDAEGSGIIDLVPTPWALDTALGLLFGLLAPHHDGILLRGTSVIGDDGAHVFLGASEPAVVASFDDVRATLTDGLVMIRRERGGWLAASTPFWAQYQQPGPAREDMLTRLWHMATAEAPDAEAHELVGAYTFLGTADPLSCGKAAWVAKAATSEVPFSVIRFEAVPPTCTDADFSSWVPAR